MTEKYRVLKVYWNDSQRYLENDFETNLPLELAEMLNLVSRSNLYTLNNNPKIIDDTDIEFLEDHLIQIDDLNQLLDKTKNIKYDCIFMMSFGTIVHDPKRIAKGIDTLFKNNPDFTVAGHLMHVGLWKQHRPEFNNLFTLHQQTCILSKQAIDILRQAKFVFNNDLEYETDSWFNVGRSEENVHDDYTPEWISKGSDQLLLDGIDMYKNHDFGFGEDLIQFAVQHDWKMINLNNDLRKGKCFSYFLDNPEELLKCLKIKEKKELNSLKDNGLISEDNYDFTIHLVKAQHDRFSAYNNEILYNNLPDLTYDCLVGPASGYLTWYYLVNYNFADNTEVMVIDVNDHALNFQSWFLNNFDPELDISWEEWINKFTQQYDQPLDHTLDDSKFVDSCNKHWEEIYPVLREKWKYIKNYKFKFECSTIVNYKLVGDFISKKNQPLVWTSNIFNYMLSWTDIDIIDGYEDFINNLIINNINTKWFGNTPWGLNQASFIKVDSLPVKYFEEKNIVDFDYKSFIKEIEVLEQNDLFTKHISSTSKGCESFTIHAERFTEEAQKFTPTIVKYLQDNLGSFFDRYNRVRIMKVSSGGVIGVHNENEDDDNFWALNLAINNPEDCKMHFWDRQMRYLGIVPWQPAKAFRIRTGMNHMILNKSNEARYHMIIDGDQVK